LTKNTADFAEQGLSTENPLARKLWLASRIQGHSNPFGKALVDYSVAELDFVLEMASLESPPLCDFQRAGALRITQAAINAAWHDVRSGKALQESAVGKAADLAARIAAAWGRKNSGGLVPGMSKGGRPMGG
jgi:hypothetical protein